MGNSAKNSLAPFIGVITLAPVVFVINLFLTIVIFRSPNLRRRRSNQFVANLTIAHTVISFTMICFGSAVLAMNAEEYIFKDGSSPPMKLGIMFVIVFAFSTLVMVLLSIDRLLAVTWTYRYFDSVTTTHIRAAMVAPWVIALLHFIVLFTLFQLKTGLKMAIYVSFDVTVALGFLILSVSNCCLYKVAKRHLRDISRTSTKPNRQTGKRQESTDREYRIAFINVGIVVKYIILWSPAIVSMSYSQKYGEIISKEYEFVSWYLTLLNCICDPLMYVFLSKDIKTEIRHLFFTDEEVESINTNVSTLPL